MESIPWYRQFWPWFLIALPATVVVAGLSTWWIAARDADTLVVDDYYKEGLAINRVLHRQELARQLGLSATISTGPEAVEVRLSGEQQPTAITLMLSHPLDAGRDQDVLLAQILPGLYRGAVRLPAASRWIWRVEPVGTSAEETWRLDGELVVSHVDAR